MPDETKNQKTTRHLWIDADACPSEIRELVYRAAFRRGLRVTLVANRRIDYPEHPNIDFILVQTSADAADHYIVEQAEPEHLVVTADLPLADLLVTKGLRAVNPRGTLYTVDTVGERLGTRNLMEHLREAGLVTGGPPPFSAKDIQRFANVLDRYLNQKN